MVRSFQALSDINSLNYIFRLLRAYVHTHWMDSTKTQAAATDKLGGHDRRVHIIFSIYRSEGFTRSVVSAELT